MRIATDILIRDIEKRGSAMKNFYLLLFIFSAAFAGGCKEDLPPPDPEKELILNTVVQCPKCRKSCEIGKFERVNQALGRCPFCKKVVNVMEAKDKSGRRGQGG